MIGTISRAMLEALIWHNVLNYNLQIVIPEYEDLSPLIERWHEVGPSTLPQMPDSWRTQHLDLSLLVDSGAFRVAEVMSLSRVYHLFRSLSLRQLFVVDNRNCVLGVITRGNLVSSRMLERLSA